MIPQFDHKWHGCFGAVARRMTMAIALSITSFAASAQTVCDSTEVRFRQSVSELDTTFAGNGARLRRMTRSLDGIADSAAVYRLKSVRVVGAASPEGTVSFNRELSQRRAESIFDYFACCDIDTGSLSFDFVGRDWAGLLRLVSEDPSVPFRDQVLKIVESVIAAGSSDAAIGNNALARLKKLAGGSAYNYIYNRLFPQLRMSRLFVEYEQISRPLPPVVDMPEPQFADTLLEPDAVIEREIIEDFIPAVRSDQRRPFYMALKTNMLSDALALPNIEAEFYLGRGWSLGAEWTYGWWAHDSRHRYWRAYGGDIALRRWIGHAAEEKPLTGHHLGVYAGVVTYDFEFGHTGYMGGNPGGNIFDRCNYYGGIEYGYSLPVGRRLNIDFTIGIGYLGGEYQKYIPCSSGEGYLWQSTHRIGWFGPTKAEISLVWLIGRDNVNRNK